VSNRWPLHKFIKLRRILTFSLKVLGRHDRCDRAIDFPSTILLYLFFPSYGLSDMLSKSDFLCTTLMMNSFYVFLFFVSVPTVCIILIRSLETTSTFHNDPHVSVMTVLLALNYYSLRFSSTVVTNSIIF